MFRSRLKTRVTAVNDRTLAALMKAAAKRIDGPPRAFPGSTRLEGVFLLQTNNVLEVYKTPEGKLSGYLFNNLDVWLTYEPVPAPDTFL
jgi:hypothetical protein